MSKSSVLNPAPLADALARLEDTGETDLSGATALFGARGENLDRLLTVASRVRDEGLARASREGIITYSKKVFLPVTQLCQDRCHYCVFVETPGGLLKKGIPTYLPPDEILRIAREGASLGCKEALFTLGDRPENRWPVARQWLDGHGYTSTLDYIGAMAELVLTETGLLPHLNPGVMSFAELQRLRPVAASMGMMLETTATRLWSERGGVHFGSPDKDPALRMRVIDDAGRSRIPFTTGVLLGIGENHAERAEALFAIRASHQRYGQVQETIVQNFRAKPHTAMQNETDLALEEYAAAVAVARIVMGPNHTIQAPPNLSELSELLLLVRAGIDDWGGVSPLTPDHVNPERPWPELQTLAELTAQAGFTLRERLTAHPAYLRDPETWLDPRVTPAVTALADPVSLLADEAARVRPAPPAAAGLPRRADPTIVSALARASIAPASLTDADYCSLLTARGDDLDAVTTLADEVRSAAVGDTLTYVVNRNLDSSLYGQGLTDDMIRRLVEEAVTLGATEICVQGPIDQALPGTAYRDFAAAVRAAGPDLSLHAFRPSEVLDGARRMGLSVEDFLEGLHEAGVTSVPGTGARILDDGVRALLSEGTDPPIDEWIRPLVAAHRSGLRSTATIVYGHVETPAQIVAHLRRLTRIQDETGGFSEFIAMPYVPFDVPSGVRAVAGEGPGLEASRALHAVARLLLHGRVDHVQAAWTKLGFHGAAAVLAGGADDFGGLLLDGAIWPEAGAEAYREATPSDVQRIATALGREARERTTSYALVERGFA
ncbi:7,8-didemethyl-8-hydroxy-5-deazariboflavin synthase, CofG subunit [Pseudarthrobacter siccitolerans]|uniref:7,8-didemethyl-8-hydroxy-5-deazariboflavin synthase n=1 Tax=Pseudarthrobacter siccitolerans TaxID=861266 RepID=A0A024H7N0_9MICC|nr:7,8-didemethyl-8-hydroxy-5-deazariboflavin synthase CofG [Pseudarthrobacter siccitolerans]CCQ48175.1 7,8-didemethyl-8-hydroxy-5-deazariboflavin synthase, CofG subunit [Pseudarthrobacter siccitolerans]